MHGEKIMPSSSCETEGLKLAFLLEIVLYFKFIVCQPVFEVSVQ